MKMWGSKTKRKTAADKWHTKAMLVDPKKTRIIMISAETTNTDETTELELGATTHNLHSMELIPSSYATDPVEFETDEPNSETVEMTAEASAFCDSAKNLGTTEQNSETTELVSPEALFADSVTEDLILEANVETPITRDAAENVTTEPMAGTTKPNLAELEPKRKNTELNVRPMEQNVVDITNHCETSESTYGMVCADPEPLNVKFLKALEKTRILWDNDRQLTKIVQKMQKGKNLKRKEFDKVYFYIREYLQYC